MAEVEYAEKALALDETLQRVASALEGGGIATTLTAGKTKPDGITISVAQDGTISVVGGSVSAEAAARIMEDFNRYYNLFSGSGTIRKNQAGDTVITETDSTNNVTKVSTIEKTSSTVTTFTDVITPDAGDYIYTRVETFTKVTGGVDYAVTITISEKED